MDVTKRFSLRKTPTSSGIVQGAMSTMSQVSQKQQQQQLKQQQQQAQQQQAQQNGEIPVVYLSKLTKPDFQPEDYLKETLKSISEKNIRLFRKSLEDSRRVASRNLQKNVYKNYESFVVISKQISSMERDMQLLRELLHSISQIGGDLMEEDKQGTDSEDAVSRFTKRRTMRMSMANQQDLFKDQLTKIWRTIQGAQRFVPFSPTRHVIGEVKYINELSPSTLQVRQKIDAVILNDILLLAVRRRRGNYSQTVAVADRAFSMSDVTATDVSDSQSSENIVKIVNRAETFLFSFNRLESKREFLQLINHAKSDIFGPDAALMPMPLQTSNIPPIPSLQGSGSEPGIQKSSPLKGNSENNRNDADEDSYKEHMNEMVDTLDISIARREFGQSTQLVEHIMRSLSESAKGADAIRKSVEDHIAELARLILADLLIPCSPRKQVANNISLLHRLGWDKEAKEAFLSSRSLTIKNRTRQLKLEGNTRLYIRELAVVYFRLIRNTCEWYSDFFKDPTMMSALIAWVRQEMAGYAVIFRRHVFHDQQKFQVIASCLKHTLVEVEILGHAGLDLKFMLDQEFFPDLTGCIRSYENRCISVLNKTVSEDDLSVVSKISTTNSEHLTNIFGPHIPLIASVVRLDETLTDFGNELQYIVHDSLYSQSVASISSIIEDILKQFLNVLRKSGLSYSQECALLVNTQATVSWVIPRSASQLDRAFDRTVTDIHNLEQRLEVFPSTLQDVFCQKHSVIIARSTFDFVTTDFDMEQTVDDNMRPSTEMEQLLTTFGTIARELDQWPLPKRGILSEIIDCIFIQMIEPRNWETSKGEKRLFSHYGVHRLVLDIHFLLRVCGSLVSKSTNDMANKVCEKALRTYFSTHRSKSSGGGSKDMKNRPWYDGRVMEAMERLGYNFPNFGKGFEHRAQQSFDPNAKGGQSETRAIPSNADSSLSSERHSPREIDTE